MSAAKPHGVVIVGSANIDSVFTVDRIPRPGETLLAESAARYPGGKGLNQAVAAARSGAATSFLGAFGDDSFGDSLAQTLEEAGIAGELVRRERGDTGQAFIVVDRGAENTIVVASGTNATMTELSPHESAAVEAAAVLLMQLELPMGMVVQAAGVAHRAGRIVMLNAAPATELAEELFQALDYLIVNEHEACLIAGLDDLTAASMALAARVNRLIVTLGAEGAAVYDGGVLAGTVNPPKVTPVDTTGAGDTFCGAFAAAIAEGQELMHAARFATVAAALSVEVVGAVPSIPQRSSIERELAAGPGEP